MSKRSGRTNRKRRNTMKRRNTKKRRNTMKRKNTMKRINTIRRLGHRNSSRSGRKIKKSNTLYGGAPPIPTQAIIDAGIYGYPYILKPNSTGTLITITDYKWETDPATKIRSRKQISTDVAAEDKMYKIRGKVDGGYIIYLSTGNTGLIKDGDCQLIKITPDMFVWNGNVGGDPKFAKWEVNIN